MIRLTQQEYTDLYGQDSLKGLQQPQTESNLMGRTQEAFGAGISKIQSGYEQAKGGNPFSAGLKYGAGAIEAASAPVTAALQPIVEPTIGAGIKYAADKISDIPAVQKFAMSDAGKVAANVAEDVGNAATIAGTVAGFAGAKTPELPKNQAITGSALKEQAQTALSAQSPKIMQRVARISKTKQARFEQMAGEGVGDYLTKRGIFGTPEEIVSKLYERFSTSKAVADAELDKLPGRYKNSPLGTMLKEVTEREKKVSTPGAPSQTLGDVKQLIRSWNEGGLNHTEINQLKRIYERTVKTEYLRQNMSTDVARATNLDSAVRNWQLKQAVKQGFTNLKEVNRETRLAKQLMDDLQPEQAGSAANNAVSLTDWIMLSGGDPTAIAAFFTKKAFSSARIQSSLAKKLYRGETIGPVTAEVGPTQIKALPAPTSEFRSQIGSGKTIPVAQAGRNIELTSKEGITPTKLPKQ